MLNPEHRLHTATVTSLLDGRALLCHSTVALSCGRSNKAAHTPTHLQFLGYSGDCSLCFLQLRLRLLEVGRHLLHLLLLRLCLGAVGVDLRG